MRVTGHHHVDVLARQARQRLAHFVERHPQVADHLLQVHAHVEHDLVVAAARGVQVTAGGADDLGQSPLDGRVDVLV